MKVDPIRIILEPDFKADCNIYLISGNEITLMNKIKDFLIYNLKKTGQFEIQRIMNVGSIDENFSLFNKKKLFIVNSIDGLGKVSVSFLKKSNNIFMFISENSPKTNSIKKSILNEKNISIIDCYELAKDSKLKILNNFLNQNNININEGLFWDLIDMLDNRYMLLEKELAKLKEIDSKNINYEILKKTISNNDELDDKIFFKLINSSEIIVNSYNSAVTNDVEANKLYFSIKKFTNLILNYEDKNDFENNIPRYLFREKRDFISIFSKFNLKKKQKLIDLIFNTDKAMRKNSGLSVVMGLRFLLNLKKIIIS